MIYCRCSIHKHIVQNESTRGKTKIILLTLEMARQEVSRTTHIEEGELRVTHENAILTNITGSTPTSPNEALDLTIKPKKIKNNHLRHPQLTFFPHKSLSESGTHFHSVPNVSQKIIANTYLNRLTYDPESVDFLKVLNLCKSMKI